VKGVFIMTTKKENAEKMVEKLVQIPENNLQYILGFIAGLESAKAESTEQEPPKAS
jgi:hypothetical protein